ncbi:MAG TPA: tetratricopeptide repeat protein [bacterium]|nr:tetratricopeptide repeat protein [bacterium]
MIFAEHIDKEMSERGARAPGSRATRFRRRAACLCFAAAVLLAGAAPRAAEAYRTVAVIDYSEKLSADDTALTSAINTSLAYRIEALPGAGVVPESDIETYLRAADIRKLWNQDKPAAKEFGRMSNADLVVMGRHWRLSSGPMNSEFRVLYMPPGDPARTSRINFKSSIDNVSEYQKKIFDGVISELPIKAPAGFWAGQRVIRNKDAFRHFGRGIMNINSQKAEAGLSDFDRALKVEPDARDIHYYLGRYFTTRQFDFNRAVERLEKVASARGGDAGAQYWLGFTYYLKADSQSALKSFERAKSLDPGSLETLLMLGMLYNEKGDYEQAIKNYRAALALAPHRASVWYSLAAAAAVSGKRDEALAALRRSLELDAATFHLPARTDADFASLRSLREFREIIDGLRP